MSFRINIRLGTSHGVIEGHRLICLPHDVDDYKEVVDFQRTESRNESREQE
jgi:hypothetical protein